MKMSIKKMIGSALLCCSALLAPVLALPQTALAIEGWTPNAAISGMAGHSVSVKKFDEQTLMNWVQTIAMWLLGIAVILFVFKVVLTAVDRLIFGNQDGNVQFGGNGGGGKGGGDAGILTKIPAIGAYPANVPWKEIWIHLAKNIAIVAGAWVVVQLIVQVVLWLFGTVTKV